MNRIISGALALWAVAALCFAAPPDAATPPTDAVEVVAEGSGTDLAAARKDALRAAVSQVVGMLVVASDQVRNDAVIESKILTYSDGFVESWKQIGKESSGGGQTRLRVLARVRRGKLTETLTLNAVPVREVDLGSVQAKSETVAAQNRSAEEIVTEAFTAFPDALLIAEPLEPRRVSGDENESVIEVPVRVKLDPGKWKIWFERTKRMLDAIAETKGTEKWNLKGPGWYPFPASNAKLQKDDWRTSLSTDFERLGSRTDSQSIVSRNLRLALLFPDSVRSGAQVVGLEYPAMTPIPPIASYNGKGSAHATKERWIGILDSVGGKLHWWTLPEAAWERAGALLLRAPRLEVNLTNDAGESLGTTVQPWSVHGKHPQGGQVPYFDESDGLGGPEAWVGGDDRGGGWIGCLPLSNIRYAAGQRGPSDTGANCAEFWKRVRDGSRQANGYLVLPAALSGSKPLVAAPAIVLPFRFRISAEEMSEVSTAKVTAAIGVSTP